MATLKMGNPEDLTSQQIKILHFLADGAQSMKQICRHLAVAQNHAAKIVKPLVENKFITKQGNGQYRNLIKKEDLPALLVVKSDTAAPESNTVAEQPAGRESFAPSQERIDADLAHLSAIYSDKWFIDHDLVCLHAGELLLFIEAEWPAHLYFGVTPMFTQNDILANRVKLGLQTVSCGSCEKPMVPDEIKYLSHTCNNCENISMQHFHNELLPGKPMELSQAEITIGQDERTAAITAPPGVITLPGKFENFPDAFLMQALKVDTVHLLSDPPRDYSTGDFCGNHIALSAREQLTDISSIHSLNVDDDCLTIKRRDEITPPATVKEAIAELDHLGSRLTHLEGLGQLVASADAKIHYLTALRLFLLKYSPKNLPILEEITADYQQLAALKGLVA